SERVEIDAFTLTDLVRFAGASGDFNPIHHDAAAAARAGFPGVIAMGMLSAGILGTLASAALRPRPVRSFAVRFRRPVFLGQPLHVVTERDGGDPNRISVELRCDDVVVVSAVASSLTPPKPSAPPPLDPPPGHELAPVVLPVEAGQITQYRRAIRAP